jgi:hypothetical protein
MAKSLDWKLIAGGAQSIEPAEILRFPRSMKSKARLKENSAQLSPPEPPVIFCEGSATLGAINRSLVTGHGMKSHTKSAPGLWRNGVEGVAKWKA